MADVKIFRDALIVLSVLVIVSGSLACREKTPPPPVDIDQVDDDGSSRDKHIFREEIRRESENARERLREEFRDR